MPLNLQQVDVLHVGLLVVALLLSAFFSSSETAFVSLQRIRLRHLERTGASGVARLRRLVDQSDRTLAAILIGNNLTNTGAAALGTVIVATLLGPEAAIVVATISVTALLLVFGEITPKTVAFRHSERVSLLYALPLEVISFLFAPITGLLSRLGAAVAAAVGGDPTRTGLSQEEIRTVIFMGEEAGTLLRQETEILRNVLELEQTVVREVMVPRMEVVGVQARRTVEDAARLVAERGYTSMPVYEESMDQVVGFVHSKDILVHHLAGRGGATAREIMRPALFTPETKSVLSLLSEMREQRTQVAVVLDEYGGCAGIVTIEDLLEEVVGEITSEYGVERRLFRSLTEREVVVDAAVSLYDLNEAFDVSLPTRESDTLGGFIFEQLGRIPNAGDRLEYDGLELVVLSMRGRRIGVVRITKQPAD